MIKEPEKLRQLEEIIKKSDNIVFFGGAGVSTESGIPDFRSTDGLYNQEYSEPPEEILSYGFFMRYPEVFFKFYRERMIYKDAKPNHAHYALAELERKKKLRAVITQNIDGLHRAAGSNNVLELHGSVYWNFCMECGKRYDLDYVMNSDGVPRCECGGIVKPDVVLYGEPLDMHTAQMAAAYCASADTLIVGGTSLMVQPAASFIDNYLGDRLILINRDKTPKDSYAHLVIRDSISEVFENIKI